jgi:hypothetical protein
MYVGKEAEVKMSSNLCRDNCVCGKYTFTLGDFIDKPIEFRQTGRYPPRLGTKLECPVCKKVYFAWVRYGDTYWSDPADAGKDYVRYPGHDSIVNVFKGKFAYQHEGNWYNLGYYTIDLAYYETGRDEGVGLEVLNPAYQWLGVDEPLTKWDMPGRYDEDTSTT